MLIARFRSTSQRTNLPPLLQLFPHHWRTTVGCSKWHGVFHQVVSPRRTTLYDPTIQCVPSEFLIGLLSVGALIRLMDCVLISPSVVQHNGFRAATCAITLWSNRSRWVLIHLARPLYLPLEDARMIHRFTLEIKDKI
jgi:hypothetical protein